MDHIELKSISCKAVKSFVPFQKPSLSIAVSLAKSDESPKQKDPQRSPIDKENGENPEWEAPMRFDLSDPTDLNDLFLCFEIKNNGGLIGNGVVGRVRVPVAELAAEQMPGIFHFVSYQVKSQDDKPNGVLTFGYKMKDKQEFDSLSTWAVQPINHPPPMTDPANFFRPPEFSSPMSGMYNPMPETNSMYPMIDTSPIYPSLQPEVGSMYPPMPEMGTMYPRPLGYGCCDYPVSPPPPPLMMPPPPLAWGGEYYDYPPPPAEGNGGYHVPQGSGCAYPEPAEVVYRLDSWNHRTIS